MTQQTLETVFSDIGNINSQLILLVGPNRDAKFHLLNEFGAARNLRPRNLGVELGRQLAATPKNGRALLVGELLRSFAVTDSAETALLIINIELLFEPSLQINPLGLLKGLAHAKRVVAVWPGDIRGDRLVYADMSHPEHRDYSRDGVVVLEI